MRKVPGSRFDREAARIVGLMEGSTGISRFWRYAIEGALVIGGLLFANLASQSGTTLYELSSAALLWIGWNTSWILVALTCRSTVTCVVLREKSSEEEST